MQIKRFTFWTALLLSAAMLWGCGSNGSGGSDVAPTPTPENVQTLGVVNCVKCHSAATPETSSWLESAHGNSNGSMRYGDPRGPHDESSSCQPCHNQLLDGDKLDEAFTDIQIGVTSDGDPVLASGERDIVTCESCHGGGSAHRGVGPIPYARPDWQQCTACHDHAEGVRHADDHGMLASNVGASAHNNADNLHASTTRCQRCHSAEGAVQLARYTGDADVMHLMDDLDPIDEEENLHPVTCSACHVPHDDSGRWEDFIVNNNDLASGNWDPNGNGVADEFDFCTSCHSFYNQDGVLIGSGSAASGTAPFYHNTAWYRTLTTTHYDNPNTLSGQGSEDLEANPPVINKIEGYVIRENSDNPCFDCHGHELRTNTANSQEDPDPNDPDQGSTIHTQWASSAHAGRLLPQVIAAAEAVECDPNDPETARGRCPDIVDAAMNAYVSDSTGAGWAHYNWDEAGRADCQECHTATGAMNYLEDPVGYVAKRDSDTLDNDFSHLANWNATDGSPQNEMLYCWGCHSNSGTGVLRNPGAIARPYAVGGVEVVLPDVGNSNVCINCHGARGNMEEYGLTEDPAADMSALKPGFGPGTKNVTEAHYLVAAATLYAEQTRIGYEFAGQDYAPVSYFAHDGIGLNEDSPETGSGPCAACHMETAETHTFEIVEKNAEGVITALNATSCSGCHDGEHGAALVAEDGSLGTAAAAAAFLEEEAEGYHEALELLNQALAARDLNFSADYPYFSADSWINEGAFGAAHNYNYLHHEPGAYAHNRIYAKRLIFDSLDWLDNFALDGSITIDAAANPAAAHWFEADASGNATRP